MTHPPAPIDFESLGRELLGRAGELLPRWLPGGRVIGREYTCGNIRGERGDSFKVNLDTGRWADFAGNEAGGDLISLYAAIEGVKQIEAAGELSGGHRAAPAPGRAAPRPSAPELGPPPPGTPAPDFGAPVGTWVYRDGGGAVLFYVCRYDGERKQFRPWSWETARREWVQRGWPPLRPLYGLPDLAARPDAPVLVVEGEKSADAATAIADNAYVVVTWPNGSNSWAKANWAPLKGRRVLIWPDADDAGETAGLGIARFLVATCPEVKLLEPRRPLRGAENGTAFLPAEGWDAADALSDGWDWQRLKTWARPRARIITEDAPDRVPEIVPPLGDQDRQGGPTLTVVEDGPQGPQYGVWGALGIVMTKSGHPIPSSDNARRCLDDECFRDTVWFDEFSGRIMTTRARGGSTRPRGWDDVDDVALLVEIQRRFNLQKFTSTHVRDAVLLYAHDHRKNPPRDWLNGLQWDGTPRLRFLFASYFACRGGVNPYTEAVSRNFLLSVVARIFEPGCKADDMPIIEGPQGPGKSSALRCLGGTEYFAEVRRDVQSKDFQAALAGRILVELPEVDRVFRAGDGEELKAVLSCQVDTYRPPYGHAILDIPRQAIIVGTTNAEDYLPDAEGNRRFLPIYTPEVDLDGLARDRDQLFAEAVVEYRARPVWWEYPPEAAGERDQRRAVDEWQQTVLDYASGFGSTTTAEIGLNALHIDKGKLDRHTAMRIANILRRAGWTREQIRRDSSRLWRYVNPISNKPSL